MCELKIGGPKVYTSVLAVLYIFTIIFYDLQKFLQYAFANDNNTHMAELNEGIEDETANYDDETVAKNRFRYANRQQSICFAAKMANISTAVTVDKVEVCSPSGDVSTLRKRSMIPSSKRFSIASHVKPHPLLHDFMNEYKHVASRDSPSAATKVQNTSPNQGNNNKWKRAVLIQSIVRNLGNAPPESPHCCPRTRQQNGHAGHTAQNGHFYKSPRPERSSTLSTTHPNETSPLLPGKSNGHANNSKHSSITNDSVLENPSTQNRKSNGGLRKKSYQSYVYDEDKIPFKKPDKVRFRVSIDEIGNCSFRSDEEKLVRHSVQSYESVLSADDEERGREYTQLSKRRGTMAPLVTLPEDLEDENNQNDYNSKFFHDKDQDWQNVDMVAWILLLCITIECFIEGIAFALTIQDAIGAGISILIAMIIKLIPQKLGDAVILSKAGLNHFWENVLSLLAVCSVYIGAIVGMALRSQLSSAQPYFFGALSGIFLYISLSSLFPVLHDIIDDNEIIRRDEYPDIDESLLFRRQQLKRLILANLGFLTAMGLVIPIVYFEEDLQRVIQDILCSLINE